MRVSRLARGAFYILLALAPLGTRYIVEMGRIGTVEIEAGTISLFGTLMGALIIVVLYFFSRRKMSSRLSWNERLLFGGALGLVTLAVLSSMLSGDFRSSVSVAWLMLGAGLCAAIYRLRPELSKSLWALTLGGVVQSALAVWQFTTQQVSPNKWLGMAAHLPELPGTFVVETLSGRWLRAYGTLAHPNMLGLYLTVATIAAIGLTISLRGRKQLGAATLIFINGFGVALTMSRSALVGLAIGLAVLLTGTFLFTKVSSQRWRVTMISVALVVVALLSSLSLLYEPAMARLTGQGRLEKISVESRFDQLSDLQMLLPSHWLFGTGPGLMPYALHQLAPGRSPWTYQYVHNVPLLVLAEVGLFGLIAWLVVVASLLIKAFQQRKLNPSPEHLAVRAIFIALLTAAMFDHFLWSSWFGQLLFWSLVGLMLLSSQQKGE